MTKYKPGFYKVKYGGEWIVAQCFGNDALIAWSIPGSDSAFSDGDFIEIGDPIAMPIKAGNQPYATDCVPIDVSVEKFLKGVLNAGIGVTVTFDDGRTVVIHGESKTYVPLKSGFGVKATGIEQIVDLLKQISSRKQWDEDLLKDMVYNLETGQIIIPLSIGNFLNPTDADENLIDMIGKTGKHYRHIFSKAGK